MDDLGNKYENEAWAGMEDMDDMDDMDDCCGECETEQATVNTVELRAQIVVHLLPYYDGYEIGAMLTSAKDIESYILYGT